MATGALFNWWVLVPMAMSIEDTLSVSHSLDIDSVGVSASLAAVYAWKNYTRYAGVGAMLVGGKIPHTHTYTCTHTHLHSPSAQT